MIGEQLGNYTITGKIGEGGMGVVYVAVHQSIGRKAAIKVLLPELSKNAEVVQRFFNEARATTLIKHPGLVDIFDFGSLPDGSAYIAMEFLEGESLASAIKRSGPMPVTRIVAIGRQIASALAAAHEKGIIHRDLKPDNIFLVPDDEASGGARVKILDFGIAKLATGNSGSSGLKTRTGMMMGTPVYMSPEQCKSSGEVDLRSDIYALGCVLYEMSCGRPPFVKEGFGEIIGAHLYEQPDPPRSIIPAISPALEGVLLRSLAKKVDDRQQSMSQLKAELDALVGGRVTAEPFVVPATITAPSIARTVIPEKPVNTTLGHSAVELPTGSVPRNSRGARKWVIGAGLVGAAAVAAVVIAVVSGSSQVNKDVKKSDPAKVDPPPGVVPAIQQPRALPAGLVAVPAGHFELGRAAYGRALAFDVPPHAVDVKAFALGRTEVTCGEYRAYVETGKARAPWPPSIPNFAILAELPVVNVSLDEAERYCRWRYPEGGRLPTEVEWEWAAGGADEHPYPWGNTWKQECVNGMKGESGVLMSAKAHDRPECSNALGLLDMSGNVWEWTSSRASAYPGSTVSVPKGEFHVIRGGSFFNTDRNDFTTTIRQFVNGPNRFLGFRCAMGPAATP